MSVRVSYSGRLDGSLTDIHQSLARGVWTARRNHFRELAQDSRCGLLAVGHYRDRSRRSQRSVTLGESVPTIFGELLHIDQAASERFAAAWMYLYHHALLVDDITDGHVDVRSPLVAMVERTYSQALERWRACDGLSGELEGLFARYYAEQMWAGAQPIGAEESLGRRAALTKFYVAVLSSYRLGRTLLPHEEAGLETICAGFQILDDVTDRAEDTTAERAQMPTRLLGLAGDRCARRLYWEGTRAATLLTTGVELLEVARESYLARFVLDYGLRIEHALRSSRGKRGEIALPRAAN